MKRFFRPALAGALAALLLCTLCGCGVKGAELSKRLIVEAVGIDAAPEGVLVTLEALDAHAAGAGSDPNEQGGVTQRLHFTGETVGQALARIAPATGLTPLFSQARVLVLGRALAEADLSGQLDYFLREYNARSDILLVMAEDSAADVIFADTKSAVPGAALLEDALTEGGKSGVCAVTKLYDFINLTLSETDTAFCPVAGVREDPARDTQTHVLTGTAFFRDGRLAFTADEDLTRGMLFLKNRIRGGSFTVRGEAGAYTLRVIGSKTKITPVRTADGGVAIEVGIKTVCDITEFVSPGFAKPGEAQAEDARSAGQAYIEALARDSLRTLFYEKRADICRFARYVDLKYPGSAAAYEETMFTSDVRLFAELTVRRTGKEGT